VAGKNIDRQVMRPDADLEKLEQQFVCVRIVQTNSLDLKLFQYDYDQSWTAFFLNADQTIYGRYGTRTDRGAKSDAHLSLASFRKAMERALRLHRDYPGNKDQLAGKRGKEPEYPIPAQIPGLEVRGKVATDRKNCIHCHMVREYTLRAKWQEGKLSPADLWVYPMPDNIGLTMDSTDGLRVKDVAAGSPAARAGMAAGDELLSLNGQPLISLADIQWVLHTAPVETRIAVTLRRGGQTLDKVVEVSGNWKESDLSWRSSSWYGLRQGLLLEPLAAADKQKRGLPADGLALAIKGLFGPSGSKLQAAGLRKDDVIVAVDGQATARTESAFLTQLRLKHGPKDSVKFTVLRGADRKELTVPMW
jgi:hypothetical protein